MIAIDTETTLITDREPVPDLVVLGVASADGCGLIAGHHREAIRHMCFRAFASDIVPLANAPYDMFILAKHDPSLWPAIIDAYERDRIVDVLTREKMIDIAQGSFLPGRGYGLDDVALRRCGIKVDKSNPWRLRYGPLRGLEISQYPQPAYDYAIADPAITYAVALEQIRFASERSCDVFSTAADQARAHLALYAQHPVRGISTDRARVDELDRRLEIEWQHCADIAVMAGMARVGGPKKRQKLVRTKAAAATAITAYCKQTEQEIRTTAKQHVAMDAMTLKRIRVPVDHPIDAYRRMGALESLRTRTISLLREPHIRSSYQEIIATARTSMREPNLQNLNRSGGFRECLVPPPGYVFVISDFGQAELVTLAQICLDRFGASKLADALRDGKDPHAILGAQLLGIPFEQFDKSKKEHADMRQLAKVPNFGYPGGLGFARFCDFALKTYDLWISEPEARKLKQSWRRAWPEMVEYFRWINSLQQPNGLYTIVHPRSGWVRGDCTYTEACNSPFQHLAAMAAKTALWELFKAGMNPRSPMFGAYQVLFVHDENVTCAPIGKAYQVMLEQERIMKAAFARWCPSIPIKVESTIADRYGK